ncbi:MAG: hypothetical protein IKJ54_06845, partial [Anaerotignum sp.]|nr:hypothetical protein [Anaerotignum sp.]
AKVSVYKTVTEGGETNREWFSSSSYRAAADEVTVGTKKAEVPVFVPVNPFEEITPVEPDVTVDVTEGEDFGIQ